MQSTAAEDPFKRRADKEREASRESNRTRFSRTISEAPWRVYRSETKPRRSRTRSRSRIPRPERSKPSVVYDDGRIAFSIKMKTPKGTGRERR